GVEGEGGGAGRHRKGAHDRLARTGLEEFGRHLPRELSGGMQQRVAICRALVHDPAVLLMDEPFAALDALTRDQMNVELLRIWSEFRKTVLFVTHGIREAVFLSDRVLVFSRRPGTIVRELAVALPRRRPCRAAAPPRPRRPRRPAAAPPPRGPRWGPRRRRPGGVPVDEPVSGGVRRRTAGDFLWPVLTGVALLLAWEASVTALGIRP